MDSLDSVKLSKIEEVISSIKRHYKDEPERIPDIEISFEFLIGTFFPNVYNNIQSALKKEHTGGYIEGLKENENKRNN